MKQKFILDPVTLTFKPHKPTFKQRLKSVGRYLTISFAIAALFFVVSILSGFSLTGKFFEKQNQTLIKELMALEKKFDKHSQDLAEIEEKDDILYRNFVGLNPLPPTIRQAGFGGTDRYHKFNILSNGRLLAKVFQKADLLENQIHIQQKSFDDIQSLGEEKVRYIAFVPSICPMRKSNYFRISDYFGTRFHPVFGEYKEHTGIDYAALPGTPVYASGGGVVAATGWDNGYGLRVLINHGYGYTTIYAHLQRIVVHVGDSIKRGKLLGFVGNTGVSTGPHLHYEVRLNNKPVNPIRYYIDDIPDDEYNQIAHK